MNIRKKSVNQERRVAREVCGRTTIASGALCFQKGDVRADALLVECKTTSKDTYTLSRAVWDKIANEATKDGLRIPVLQVDFEDDGYRPIMCALFNYNDLGQQFLTKENLVDMLENLDGESSYKSAGKSTTLSVDDRYYFLQFEDGLVLMRVPWERFVSSIIEGKV